MFLNSGHWFNVMHRKQNCGMDFASANVLKSDIPRTSCKVSIAFIPSKKLLFLYFPLSFPRAYTILFPVQ